MHLASTPDRTAAVQELRRLLRWGVTSVRDMAGDARLLASLRLETQTARIAGPDVSFAALVAGPSFLEDPRPRSASRGRPPGQAPWMQALTPTSDVSLLVARAAGTSASGLKLYADLTASQVRSLADEATRQGLPVWAHGMIYPARPLDVVRGGADVVSHVCPLAWEGVREAPARYHAPEVAPYERVSPTAPVFEELLGEMAARGTILDATLAMHTRFESGPPEGSGTWPAGPAPPCDRHFARTLVARAHELGVPIAAGTDFVTPPGEPPALFLELEALVGLAGFSPLEAIESATRIAAAAAGVDHRTGTLQAGMEVTFALLDRDPAADIRNLASVREVWKRAVRHPVNELADRP